MAGSMRNSLVTILLALVLCVSLLNVQAVRADGETPTEPPAPTQVETETPLEATPTPEATVTDFPSPATETPIIEPTPEPVPPQATPLVSAVAAVVDETSVVVLDEDGQALTLGSQETAEAIAASDPVWCPAGVAAPTPGANGCSPSYASIADLLAAMRTNPTGFDENGTIFLEKPPSPGFTTPLILDDSLASLSDSFTLLRAFDLTVRGGWNANSPGTFSGQTSFGAAGSNQGYILIGSAANPWLGDITLRNLHILNTSVANAVTVYTQGGDITLNNVDVTQQKGLGYTGYLESNAGNITVISSFFDGDNTGPDRNKGFYASTQTGSISMTGNGQYTFQDALGTGTENYNGATLSAPTVTLTNVIARGNDGNGIEIRNASLVTLNNVTGGPLLAGEGNGLSGVLLIGSATSPMVASVNGGVFAGNVRYGIEYSNASLILQNSPTCPSAGEAFANGFGCFAESDPTPPVLTPVLSGVEGDNGWYRSDVTVTWSVVDNESVVLWSVGCEPSSVSADTPGLTLTCSARSAGGTSSNSVTVKRDATAPTLSGAPNRTPDSGGAYDHLVYVVFSGVDGLSGIAICSTIPYSGPNGSGITVAGFCLDQAGNRGRALSSPFNYQAPVSTPLNPTPTATQPTPIPETVIPASATAATPTTVSTAAATSSSYASPGGGVGSLQPDCNHLYWVLGIRVSLLNLCSLQATLTGLGAGDLPAALPDGLTFVSGLRVDLFDSGKTLAELRKGTGIQMDFPAADDDPAVLYWDAEQEDWLQASELLEISDLQEALADEDAIDLYHLTGKGTDPLLFQILTTGRPGIYVLVKQ